MMFEVKLTGRAYKQLKSLVRETGKRPHEILDELLCGAPEQSIDEFNQEPIEQAPAEPVEEPVAEPAEEPEAVDTKKTKGK